MKKHIIILTALFLSLQLNAQTHLQNDSLNIPVILVDGVEVQNLDSLKQDDIISVNIVKDKNILKHIDNKVFAKDLLNQKKGKYVEINKGKIFEKEILFFPYNRNNLELKVIGNENVNFDTVRIEFQNFIGKVIGFKIIYNGNEKELTQKTYQYQNKNWVEIPTTDEYKF